MESKVFFKINLTTHIMEWSWHPRSNRLSGCIGYAPWKIENCGLFPMSAVSAEYTRERPLLVAQALWLSKWHFSRSAKRTFRPFANSRCSSDLLSNAECKLSIYLIVAKFAREPSRIENCLEHVLSCIQKSNVHFSKSEQKWKMQQKNCCKREYYRG